MKEHRAILNEVHPDLLQPPHSLDWLMHMVLDTWQPDPSQLKQLVAHLAECKYCRTASIVLLAAESTYDQSSETSETTEADISRILTQFVKIHQELQAIGNEQMNAYAEAVVAVGKEEADKCFPIVVKHVRVCRSCKNTLEDVLDFVKLSEKIE